MGRGGALRPPCQGDRFRCIRGGGAGGKSREEAVVQDGGNNLRAAEAVSSAGRKPLPERVCGAAGGAAGVGRRQLGGFLSSGAAGRVWEPRALPALLAGRGRPRRRARVATGPGAAVPPAFLRSTRPQRPRRGTEAAHRLPASPARRLDAAFRGTLLPTLFYFLLFGEVAAKFILIA